MQPFFTTNDSEIGRLEGLYVKERQPPAVISGAFFGNIGIAGECVRGPVDKVIDISSEARFKEVFGERNHVGPVNGTTSASPVGKIWLAMLNKPFGKVSCVRTAAAAAAAATATVNAFLTITANGPGIWGNDITYDIITPSSDGVAGKFDVNVYWGGRKDRLRNVNITTGNDNTAIVSGTDDGRLVTLSKAGSGTPTPVTGVALTGGSDGVIADTDFTAAGRGLNLLAGYRGLGAIMPAERMSTALRAYQNTLAGSGKFNDRLFLIGPDNETISYATHVTDVSTFRATDRVVPCFNHAYTIDPTTGIEQVTHPMSWMASILSQVDVDIHVGEESTKRILSGISRLYNESYTRDDYIAMHDGGICALEKDNGFAFVSGVSTFAPDGSGKEQITRRRMADFLQLSIAQTLKFSVKKKNTISRRMANAGMVTSFLADLQKAERIVSSDDPASGKGFAVDPEKLNTAAQRAQGIEKLLTRVRLIGHMLSLVFETEIGTTVQITQVQ